MTAQPCSLGAAQNLASPGGFHLRALSVPKDGQTDILQKKMGKLSIFWTGFYETRWQVDRKTPKREDAQTVFKSCPQRRSEGPSALRLHVPQQTEVHLLSLVSLEPRFLLLPWVCRFSPS